MSLNDDTRRSLWVGAVAPALIKELENLAVWIRTKMDIEYQRDDAPDEIARACENRARVIRAAMKEQPK